MTVFPTEVPSQLYPSNLLFHPRTAPGRPEFIPPGFECLAEAIEKFGRSLFPADWAGDEARARQLPALPADNPKAEFHLLCRAGERIRKNDPLGKPQYSIRPIQPDAYKTERLAGERWETAILHVRKLLCAVRLSAVALDAGGYMHPVPVNAWTSDKAHRLFSSGRARFLPDSAHVLSSPTEGWILLKADELEKILNSEMSSHTAGAEAKCLQWLEELMRDGDKTQTKAAYEEDARSKFGVSDRGFGRAWASAVRNSGRTDWSKSGPRAKP